MLIACKQDDIDNKEVSQFTNRNDQKKMKILDNSMEIYTDETLLLKIFRQNGNVKKMNFEFFKNGDKLVGTAELILVEDEDGIYYVPERSSVFDERNKEDYVCDSTFSYHNKNVSLAFSRENNKGNRLSLIVYKSIHKNLNNGFYTLYKK